MDRRDFLKAAGISPLATISLIGAAEAQEDERFVLECDDWLPVEHQVTIQRHWSEWWGKSPPKLLVLDGGRKLKRVNGAAE